MLGGAVEVLDAVGSGEVRELFAAVEHPGGMEVPHPTDGELVGLARAGQVQALAALSERYRASLYAAAVRLLRDRDEARDARSA